MNRFVLRVVLATFFVVSVAGCYHATVETGLAPSTQTIDIPWANSFVYGLVPPATVQAASQCPNGVAKVETKLSFLNGLVSVLTLSLYTPMTIKVTCASGGTANLTDEVPEILVSQAGGVANAFGDAADLAVKIGGPVHVRFD